ncbi:MAG: hypothetical protein H6Q73_3885 [Firmicutes bacterium]|nr:hypothetical protein [Bacillota bacterium]
MKNISILLNCILLTVVGPVVLASPLAVINRLMLGW